MQHTINNNEMDHLARAGEFLLTCALFIITSAATVSLIQGLAGIATFISGCANVYNIFFKKPKK